MSVTVGLRIAVDPERMLEALVSDRERLLAISERAKQLGCLHHRFFANVDGGEALVVDEWESAEAFQQFFAAGEDIREMMGAAGVNSEPELKFWRELDTPDKF
jgi:heme-degrading monooxygenase HmoA